MFNSQPCTIAGLFLATNMMTNSKLERVLAGLAEIGIATTIDATAKGFLDKIRIVDGRLHVAPDCPVGDVLHEAGHLAIIPRRYRSRANNDIGRLQREMLEDMTRTNEFPDSPIYRAVLQTSDPEATAWAYAFGKHLGLADEDIIEDHSYPDETGKGTGADIRLSLSMRAYVGINGLAHAGFCSFRGLGGLPKYPEMAFWTQEL